jgi:hypothetical protein
MTSGYRTLALAFVGAVMALAVIVAPARVATESGIRSLDLKGVLAHELETRAPSSSEQSQDRLELTLASVSPAPSWTAEGDQDSSYFGRSIASAGDVNNDGYDDLIVGAMSYDGDLEDEGVAMVFHGSPSGLTTAAAWSVEGDEETALYGCDVDCAGDVNGDGYDDIIVGALYPNSLSNAGKAFVYHGGPAGLPTVPAWEYAGEDHGDLFGFAVAGAGDVNGDGYGDVIIGARGVMVGTVRVGAVYGFYGSPSGLSHTPDWVVTGSDASANFGMAVAGAGDVNRDGYSDVIVAAPNYSSPELSEGKVFVYEGGPAGLATTPVWTREGNAENANLGFSLGGGGDVNDDGYDDIVIGAYGLTISGVRAGGAFVHLGGAFGPSATADWTMYGDQNEDYFGYSVSDKGDLNADGYDDVIVGAPLYDRGETDEGIVFVYYGHAGGPSVAPDMTAEANQPESHFGRIAGDAGDVNGDGVSDMFVGATGYDDGQGDEGAAFAFYSAGGAPGRLEASIYFDPRTLNLKSEGSYVGCTVQLPEGYDTRDIDEASVLLNGIVPAIPGTPEGGGGKRDFKFDRAYVQALFCAYPEGSPTAAMGGTPPIGHGAQFALHVSGELDDGTGWAGRDTSRVIHQGDCEPVSCDITPSVLGFGVVDRGSHSEQHFTITNTGTTVALGMVGEACPEFEIVDGGGPYLLDPGDSRHVTVRFTPATCGDKTCEIFTGACGNVTATGTAGPLHACEITPATLDFGDVPIGTTATERIRIRNTGCEPLTGTVGPPCAGFAIVSGAGSYTLASGEYRDVVIEFSPTTCGMHTCTLDTGSPYCGDVLIMGNSSGPVCSIYPDTLRFGAVGPGVSKDMTFTISNNGCDPFSGDVWSPYAAFVLGAGGGPFTLNPGDSRTVTVTYTGISCGLHHAAELGLGTPSGLCPSVMCYGETGGTGCHISPPGLAFGDVNIGSVMDASFTITNMGCETLTGTVSESCPEFSILSGGGAYSLAPGAVRTVTVRFAPTSTGSKTCFVTAGCGDVLCEGTGTSAVSCSVVPASIDFGTVPIGTCDDQSVTITNMSAIMTLTGTIAPPFSGSCANFSIPAGGGTYSIGPGASHTFTVRYCPSACVTNNCTISTGCTNVTMEGSGTGGGCTVSVDSLDFGAIVPGTPSTVDRAFTITNTGCTVISGVVTESCLYYFLVGQVNYSLLPGESQTFAVRYAPDAPGTHTCVIDTGAPCDIGVVCTGTLAATSSSASMEVYTADPLTEIKISFALAKAGPISLTIYDAAGRLVRTLENGHVEAGMHHREWDRRTDGGAKVNSGIYFIKLSCEGKTLVKKAMIVQ